MGIRNQYDPFSGVIPLIDSQIGDAFEDVQDVANNLGNVKSVADNIALVSGAVPAANTAITKAAEASTSAQTATTKAAEAAASAVQATTNGATAGASAGLAAVQPVLDNTLAARDAAAVSAASANALNPAVYADTGNVSLAFAVTDAVGNSALEIGTDGTFRLTMATVQALGDGTLRLGRRDGTASVDLKADGSATLGGVTMAAGAGTDYAWAITDDSGYSPLTVWADGTVRANSLTIAPDGASGVLLKTPDGGTVIRGLAGGSASIPGALTVTGKAAFGGADYVSDTRTDIVWGVADNLGNIALALKADGTLIGTGLGSSATATTAFSASEIAERNARALAVSNNVARQADTTTQRLIASHNHFILYGQSLSTGQEGWPARSKTSQFPGNLMLGQSVHAQGQTFTDTAWTPIGDTTLRPMVATVRDGGGGLLNDAAVAALTAGAGNLGETVLEGSLNYLRRSFLDARNLPLTSTANAFVGTSCGISGRTIEQLSKGATPELFKRTRDAATAVKTAAVAAGGDYAVPAVLFLQGEFNYDTSNGGVSDKASYKAKLLQLVSDLRADVQTTIAAQARPFAFFTYQTGAAYTRDQDALGVGMAQLECALEQNNWYMAAPVYPVTDKGGHLDSNGYRWLAQQFGKVMHRVLVRGEKWRPLSPLQATLRGRQVLVDFHVPAPPLVFALPYVVSTATDFSSKGFTLIDSNGSMTPTAEVVGDAVVRLVAPRDIVGTLTVRYAGQASYNGSGCLCDSDATEAANNYEYSAGTGDYAAANITALVGKPYPLANWCVAFNITASVG